MAPGEVLESLEFPAATAGPSGAAVDLRVAFKSHHMIAPVNHMALGEEALDLVAQARDPVWNRRQWV